MTTELEATKGYAGTLEDTLRDIKEVCQKLRADWATGQLADVPAINRIDHIIYLVNAALLEG